MPEWLLILSEIIIFVCGTGAIWLLNQNNKYSKYGVLLGLFSEPFWFVSAYHSRSWGIFALTFIYTVSYIVGVYNFWFRKKQTKSKSKR